ncbi:MAG: DUF5317 family protein [Clostridiaceae bacterium]|nr:DUF5317 family protein [Clostridiaceae bacterium]
MDKGTFDLVVFCVGLLVGLLLRRHWRPLLFERWRGLLLVPAAIIASALPYLISIWWPGSLWSDSRRLLIALVTLRYLIWSFFLALNLTPPNWTGSQNNRRLPNLQKIALIVILLGLGGEAAVFLLNHGYWPIKEDFLVQAGNPALLAGIRNQAYLMLQIIGPDTRLPWLGQIWPCSLLTGLRLAVLPTISPAEVVTAAGIFLAGAGQFLPDVRTTAEPERKT